MNKENVYYVYLHRRLSDNKVFYVGKGKNKRAWDTNKRSTWWKRAYEKHGLIVEIAFDNLDEKTAFLCEKDTILEMRYFGYPLCNMTDGGEGKSGHVQSQETKDKRSKSMAGRKLSEDHRRKISENSKARSHQLSERNTDNAIYSFLHKNGQTFQGTRLQLCTEYSLDNKTLRTLFITNCKVKTSQGWSILKETDNLEDKLVAINSIAKKVRTKPPKKNNTKYLFINKNGDSVYTTRHEFESKYLIKVSALFSTRLSHTTYSWGVAYVGEDYDQALHRIKYSKVENMYNSTDNNVYMFKHISGEVFKGTRLQLIAKYDLGEYARASLSKMFSKTKDNSVYGWALIKE